MKKQLLLFTSTVVYLFVNAHAEEVASLATSGSPGAEAFVTLTRTERPQTSLPFNSQTLNAETFERYDAQNAGDAIRQMTGVEVQPQGRLGSLRLAGIRGSTSNQTLVLIDGRPMGGVGLSASQDLAEVPVEQIDHVEVVRGGVSALYGPNAVGGVINIITKRAPVTPRPRADVTLEKRSFGNEIGRMNLGTRSGPFELTVFANHQRESGFRDNSDARTYNVGTNTGIDLGRGGKILFDVSAYHANAGQPGQLFPDIPTNQFDNDNEKIASTPDSRQKTDSGYLRSAYAVALPAESKGTVRLFSSQRRVQFDIPTFAVSTDRRERSRGGDAQVELPLGLLAGGSFVHDRLDSRDLNIPSNNYVASVENWGVFLQETFNWKWITLIPSGRYDHHSIAGESKNPRVQLIGDVTSWLRFSGSAARSFRAPTIDDLYTPFQDFGFGSSYVGNPNVRPEKAWTYDAGFEVHQESWSFRTGYFRANITDLIQTTSDLAATTVNVGRARRQGAEVELSRVWSALFRDSWNYTLLRNVGRPAGFTEFVPLRLSPRHSMNYLATLTPAPGVSFDNRLHFRSARYEGNNETGTKLGAYLLWDLRLAYRLRSLEFFSGVNDLTNKRYEERSGYPLAGRTFFGGVTLHI